MGPALVAGEEIWAGYDLVRPNVMMMDGYDAGRHLPPTQTLNVSLNASIAFMCHDDAYGLRQGKLHCGLKSAVSRGPNNPDVALPSDRASFGGVRDQELGLSETIDGDVDLSVFSTSRFSRSVS